MALFFKIIHYLFSTATVTLSALLPWIFAGAFVGLLAALVVSGLLNRSEAFKLETSKAVWLQRTAALWIAVAFVLIFGAGFGLEGLHRQARESLMRGDLRREALDKAGAACACGLMCLDFAVENHLNSAQQVSLSDEQNKELTRFEKGEVEFNVEKFFNRLKNVEAKTVQAIRPMIKSTLHSHFALQPGGTVESLVDWGVDMLSDASIRDAVLDKTGDVQVLAGVRECFATLPGAARAGGDPATITHRELSDHIIEHGLLAMLLIPLQQYVRLQHLVLALLALAAVCAPILIFWLLRRFIRPAAEAPASPAKVESTLPPAP